MANEPMTAGELVKHYLDKDCYISGPGTIRLKAMVVDVKNSYGKARFKVVPSAGTGYAWVESVELI